MPTAGVASFTRIEIQGLLRPCLQLVEAPTRQQAAAKAQAEPAHAVAEPADGGIDSDLQVGL